MRPATSVADEPQQCLTRSFQLDTRVSLHFPSVGPRNRTTRGPTHLFVTTSICRYPAINFPGRLPGTILEIKGHTPRVRAMHLPRGSPRGGCEHRNREDTLLHPDSQVGARGACCDDSGVAVRRALQCNYTRKTLSLPLPCNTQYARV